jgi:hypothetical protein
MNIVWNSRPREFKFGHSLDEPVRSQTQQQMLEATDASRQTGDVTIQKSSLFHHH